MKVYILLLVYLGATQGYNLIPDFEKESGNYQDRMSLLGIIPVCFLTLWIVTLLVKMDLNKNYLLKQTYKLIPKDSK